MFRLWTAELSAGRTMPGAQNHVSQLRQDGPLPEGLQEADAYEERKFLPGSETGRGILTLTIDPVRAISVPLYVGSAFFSAVIDTGASVSVMDNKCIPQESSLEAYTGPTLLTATVCCWHDYGEDTARKLEAVGIVCRGSRLPGSSSTRPRLFVKCWDSN